MKKEDWEYAMSVIDHLDENTSTIDDYREAVNELYSVIHFEYLHSTVIEELLKALLPTMPTDEMVECIDQYIVCHPLTNSQKEKLASIRAWLRN